MLCTGICCLGFFTVVSLFRCILFRDRYHAFRENGPKCQSVVYIVYLIALIKNMLGTIFKFTFKSFFQGSACLLAFKAMLACLATITGSEVPAVQHGGGSIILRVLLPVELYQTLPILSKIGRINWILPEAFW